MNKSCANCGQATDRPKYCSMECKERSPERRAAWRKQARDYYAKNRDKVKARQEQIRRAAGMKPMNYRVGPCAIEGCPEPLLAKQLCYRHYRQAQRTAGVPWATKSDDKQRAERHGVAYEPINRLKVYDRDGWICGICSLPVDPTVKYPNRQSASLDHIKPMSRGGDHLLSNVQCSHYACNLAKRDKEMT